MDLEPDIELPLGCDLQALAYSTDDKEAVIMVEATDKLTELREELLGHLPEEQKPTKAGKELIGEVKYIGKKLTLRQAKDLYNRWREPWEPEAEAPESPFNQVSQYIRTRDGVEEVLDSSSP